MQSTPRIAVLVLLSALAPRACADIVSAGAVNVLLAPTTGVIAAAPAVATAPTGETIVAWNRAAAASSVISVSFFDRNGTMVSGPTALNLGASTTPFVLSAGASPSGFILAFDLSARAYAAANTLVAGSYLPMR